MEACSILNLTVIVRWIYNRSLYTYVFMCIKPVLVTGTTDLNTAHNREGQLLEPDPLPLLTAALTSAGE